jgi:hypothetical protein
VVLAKPLFCEGLTAVFNFVEGMLAAEAMGYPWAWEPRRTGGARRRAESTGTGQSDCARGGEEFVIVFGIEKPGTQQGRASETAAERPGCLSGGWWQWQRQRARVSGKS